MLKQNKKWKNEKGMALIVAILVTTALVSVGTLAMMMTNTEIDISKNDRFGKEAFFFTDGGGSIYTKIISDMYWDNEPGTYSGVTVNTDFINEVMNYTNNNDGTTDSPYETPDITFNLQGKRLDMDIDWRTRIKSPGGSLLTHTGYEGAGINKAFGGVQTFFDVKYVGRTASLARKAGVSTAQLKSVYRR